MNGYSLLLLVKMCNFDCFGPRKRKSAKDGSKCQTDVSISGQSSTSSKVTRILSSPSRMFTEQLTAIYQIPTKRYSTVKQVITDNGYELGEEIGNGSYATVYKARRLRDNLVLACKELRVAPTNFDSANLSAKNELFILERVNHPNIIKLYQHFVVDIIPSQSRFVYIFMQLAEGESLSIYMRKVDFGLPEATCKRMFAQMVSAVRHIHHKRVAHRDLKMGNVLLNHKLDCMLTDFGLSRVAYRISKGGTQLSNKFCGTVPYMAPEILLSKDYRVAYDPFIADIWALGVILYCIVNRAYPFGEKPREDLLQVQMLHKIKWSKKKSFEPNYELFDLQYRLLEPNMEKRISLDQLATHPWIAAQVQQVEDLVHGGVKTDHS